MKTQQQGINLINNLVSIKISISPAAILKLKTTQK